MRGGTHVHRHTPQVRDDEGYGFSGSARASLVIKMVYRRVEGRIVHCFHEGGFVSLCVCALRSRGSMRKDDAEMSTCREAGRISDAVVRAWSHGPGGHVFWQ